MANSFLRSSPCVSSGYQYVGVRSSSSDYHGFLKSLSFSRIKSLGITRPLQTKRISPVVRATEGENNPGGFHKYRHLWVQCDVCYGLNYKPLFNSKNYICESCGYHVEMSSSDRIDLLIDPGTWVPMDEDMVSTDPLKWDFEEKKEPFQLDLSEWESEFKKVYAELEKRIHFAQSSIAPPPRDKPSCSWKAILMDLFVTNKHKIAGVGVVVRDYKGEFIASMTEQIPLTLDVHSVEAMAALKGILFAKNLGRLLIIQVEGDSFFIGEIPNAYI
ncbi:hypothetical protein Vadar_003309 [Vaccinium darrowii]|uniref:Uncharacterized protein n=1 Tax=Vaccinium darrowii TaxID=229202 RepID=A0ACB7YCJ5_9ERIC|nr:hypothetical protein Vadar_003309 [Vaccinium darrowii]